MAHKITEEVANTKSFKCPGCEHDTNSDKIWPPYECILEKGPLTFASLTDE